MTEAELAEIERRVDGNFEGINEGPSRIDALVLVAELRALRVAVLEWYESGEGWPSAAQVERQVAATSALAALARRLAGHTQDK